MITFIGTNGKDGSGLDKLLYPLSEVAAMFSVSTKTVHRLLQRGLLQSSGAFRHKMIPRSSIEKFMSTTCKGGAK
jgi:hypothetical protein